MNDLRRKLLALLLAFAMTVTLTPSMWLAYAEDEAGEAASHVEASVPEAAAPQTADSEAAEAPETAKAEDAEKEDAKDEQTQGKDEAEAPKTEAPAADEVLQVVEGETDKLKADGDIAEPDELFEGYLKLKAYGSRTRKTAGSRLKGANKGIYDYLNKEVAKVAAGQRSSTDFEFTTEEVFGDKNYWTAAELGLKNLTDVNGDLTETALDVCSDMTTILDALLADNPYALYWFDKTYYCQYCPFSLSLVINDDGEEVIMASGEAYFNLPVAKEYSVSKTIGTFEFDTGIGQSASTVVSKAQAIVDKYESSSDRDRLLRYAEEICSMVSYNNSAAGGGADYGDPWQLIWVFDGDSSTNVVCEGYSKAFKFLCDLTEFSGTIDCIVVTGTLDGGGHMWNVVTLDDGYNYIADVTNSDGGSKFVDRGLFLCNEPATGSEYPLYIFSTASGSWKYTYDAECRKTFCMNELAIPGDGTGHIPQEGEIEEPVQVESLSFEFAKLKFYEGVGGGYEYLDYDLGEYVKTSYYHYDFVPDYDIYTPGNKITVNGVTYTCNTDWEFVNDNGVKLAGTIKAKDDQSEDNPWSASNEGQITVYYKDGSCTVTVKIEKSPITEFRIEFAEEQVLYGGRDDYEVVSEIYNEETGNYEEKTWRRFWYGQNRVRNTFDGDVLVLNGDRYVCSIDGDTNTGIFTNSSGKVISESAIDVFDDQSPYDPWGAGEHEVVAYYYIDGNMAAEYKYKVRVVDNPVESIRFVPTPGFMVYKEGDDYYFIYEDGDKFIITYNDGRGEVPYTATMVPSPDGDGEVQAFLDPNGNLPQEGDPYFRPLYDRIDDSWGEGKHTFYIEYFGCIAEFEGNLSFTWESHSWGEWIVTKEATCTQEGIRERVCEDCGETQSESIPLTDHSWNPDYTVDKQATCTEEGSESIHCRVCGTKKATSVRTIEKAPHQFGEWTVTKKPTENETGEKSRSCSVCGTVQTEEIELLDHTHVPVLVNAVEASCTEKGYTGDYVCSVCGEELETGTEIAALGHSKPVSKKAKAATCQETGLKTHYECSRCGTFLDKKGKVLSAKAAKKLVVKKKAHKYKKKIQTEEYLKSAATCTKKTTYYYACSYDGCGAKGKKTYTVGKALGHDFVPGNITKATGKKDGKIASRCSRCGKTNKGVKIPKASKIVVLNKKSLAYIGDGAEKDAINVVVKSSKYPLNEGEYTVTRSEPTYNFRKRNGSGKITVTFTPECKYYSGSMTLTYKITKVPKQ